MKTRVTDTTALATQVWLIEPEAARFLLAQAIAGTLSLTEDETPIVYGYDNYGWFPSAEKANSTAVITMSGVLDSWAANYYVNQLARIFADPNVSSLIVRVNGPGGLANAGSKVADCLANAPIPTLSFVDYGQAGSAHYMIACSCKLIWTSTVNDMVGSIGTYGTYQDWTKYYEKMGVVTKDLYAEQSTEKNLDAKQAQKGNFQPIIDRMTEAATRFIDYVKAQRGDKLNYSDDNDPFKGRMFNATDALSIGLIDQIGTLPQAIQAVRALVTTTTTPDNTMFGFMKSTAFEAVKGVAAADITEAQLTAMNEQLSAMGLDNVLVVSAAQLEAATEQAAQIKTLQTQLETLNTEKNTLVSEKSTLEIKVKEYGTQPGDKPTFVAPANPKNEATETSDGPSAQQVMDALPHNIAADQMLAGFGL